MAAIKMTFNLPEQLAEQLQRRISTGKRSKFVASALNKIFSAHDRDLAEACRVANKDPDVCALEKEFDAITLRSADAAYDWL